jgi:ketosteroid isomerase-like protein
MMMREVASALALLLVLPVLSVAQTKTTEQTLMDIEHSWAATALKNDVKTLDGILAANWTGTTPEGTVQTRAESLANTKAGKFTKSEVSAMKVMVLNPTTAVVTGIWTGLGTDAKGVKVDTSERWTDVFVLQGGTWKCVASQSTTIKK